MAGEYNYELEGADISRRQKIADAMMSGALAPMGPTEMVSGRAVRQSPLAGIAKVVQALLAHKQQGDLKTEQGVLSQRYSDDLRTGMESYDRTARGSVAPIDTPLPEGVEGPTRAGEHTTGDPRKAIFDAMASNHPVLRDFAMRQLAEQSKGQLTPVELAKHATSDSILANPNDTRSWKPERKLQFAPPGTIPVDSGGNLAQLGTATGDNPGWKTVNINGDLYQQTATGLKKLDNAPKLTTTINNTTLNKGQSELAVGRAKAANEDLALAEKSNLAAKQAMATVAKMQSVNNTFSGPAAPAAVWLGQLAAGAGISVDRKKLANSETFESESARMWVNLMEQAGGARGLVKEESERIARSVPNLVHTPEGRQKLFDMVQARAQETQQIVKTKQSAMSKAAAADNPNLYFESLGELGDTSFTPVVPAGSPKRIRLEDM